MKTASVVTRYLLGLLFTIFGLNGFLHFMHQPPPANPLRATCTDTAGSGTLQHPRLPLEAQIGRWKRSRDGGLFPLGAVSLRYRKSFNGIFSAKPATQA